MLTTQEYQKAIQHAGLDNTEIEILRKLYNFPDSTANVKELSNALGQPWQGFAFRIGKIGKKISDYSGINPPHKYLVTKGGIERPAYFMFVGPYYLKEGKTKSEKPGWEMNDNLREALEILKLV